MRYLFWTYRHVMICTSFLFKFWFTVSASIEFELHSMKWEPDSQDIKGRTATAAVEKDRQQQKAQTSEKKAKLSASASNPGKKI